MSMTRRDYELLTAIMIAAKPATDATGDDKLFQDAEVVGWSRTVRMLTMALHQANPRFDESRMLNACGIITGLEPMPIPVMELLIQAMEAMLDDCERHGYIPRGSIKFKQAMELLGR